ncbi:MAG TPA: tetraacyldisaccharide 4'-kinase [Vicinamibacterales bacterium]|nr:tetraacyldisaccharide 4'-kinase [Vicinamibacterales bacterium]
MRADVLSTLYAAIARRRREFYAARPDLRRRLRRPVVSIGNLAVGGRGKTPTTASVARVLLDLGERPAILTRGYGRRRVEDGVVIVRDADGIRADLDRSGDEPLMLARQLPGVAILASGNRYLAGTLAERHLGATVHLLDDGFQHLQLDRDIDLVIVAGEDLNEEARTLPGGRLREPPDALLAADALFALDEGVFALGPKPRHAPFQMFRLRKTLGETPARRVFAVAGIARPERFFADVRAAGHELAGQQAFADHYRYSARDVERIFRAARGAGAQAVITTEKDYVRLLPYRPFAMGVVRVPLTMEPDPLPEFRSWLAGELNAARDICTRV